MVFGGGAAEIACSLAVAAQANQLADLEQYAFRAYAEALESIPLALAENSGLPPIHAVAEVKVSTKFFSSYGSYFYLKTHLFCINFFFFVFFKGKKVNVNRELFLLKGPFLLIFTSFLCVFFLKAKQVSAKDAALGIDCMLTGNMNMRDQHVIESLKSKRQQILLATQLVKMILKIDDVRSPADGQ